MGCPGLTGVELGIAIGAGLALSLGMAVDEEVRNGTAGFLAS